MSKKSILLIIDMQNDFTLPEGKLAVPNAMEDVKRLATFIKRKTKQIDHIILTQDSHQPYSIANPSFWLDRSDKHPAPFTQITPKDIREGRFRAAKKEMQQWVTEYIDQLTQQGEYTHVIWPEHCIAGTQGESIVEPLMEQIQEWSKEGRNYSVIRKGESPLVEHFGAIRANIEIEDDKRTQTNQYLINRLTEADIIYIAGEAKSHCVANTIKQILPFEQITKKLIILEDCMSDVSGFEGFGNNVFKAAQEAGALVTLSTEIQ
ncbi:MAG: hypothetical protein ACRC6R_01600 [Bacteroidales bacterium]